MSQRDINLLDLPNQILFNILKKLNNMDVLYSLLDINNQQLHIIAQDKIFTNILNFVSILSTNDNSSISNRKLDRFCFEILPQIHHNVKCLILESVSIERVLHAVECPNLTQLKIFNFNKEIISRYFKDDLLNLKCFSLICYNATGLHDNLVVPLLRRMSHLEERTLHVCILNRPTFVNGIHLHKEILIYMPRLDKLTFYINTTNEINDSIHRLCNDDIQRTFSYTNHRSVISIVDYFGTYKAACHVFSLPFPFHRLQWITNNFPPIIFSSVTDLKLSDTVPFKPEFFIRIARSFPSLKYLFVRNIRSPVWSFRESSSVNDHSYSIVEYSHLILLDIDFVNIDYVDQFLNESKTRLPCLTELVVQFNALKNVTENFTRDATRRNCAKKYHIKIKDGQQPLIAVQSSKRMVKRGMKKEDSGLIFLIPELCCITEMSIYTHVGPNERFQQLNEFLNDIQKREEGRKELSKWQINLDNELVQLTGQADRSRDDRSLAHLSAKNLDKWILIYSQRDSQIAHSFVDSLYKIELPDDRSEAFIRAIENKANPQLDLVCCILTNNRKDRCDAIKNVLYVDCPVPSQMLLSKTLQKPGQLLSVATKFGIEINAKLGGEIWASKTLMRIGIDTYRDSQSRSSQMVGFVASINPTCTRYYPRVIEQRSTKDFISGLKSCMQNALQKYHHVNGVLPAKIIVYRDGVNDLQLLDVTENKLPVLNEICMKTQEGYE
ncbi:unnamed protein product [Rotaria magnacalcarata]